jgi:spermidine synthase
MPVHKNIRSDKKEPRVSSFRLMLVPSLTVFISSACIMILELVGGRLIARHLGASLYTWTSIIGVVLLGISIGNYIGGRLADRFATAKTLAVIFAVSSVTCILIIAANNLVGTFGWLGRLNWPVHVFAHICLVFLLPSVVLGTISPVVAKRALDNGLAAGRTIGDLYAWAAIGSIVGTFATGFYLIAHFGTVATIKGVSIVVLIMSIAYYRRFWLVYAWAALLLGSILAGAFFPNAVTDIGSSLFLSRPYDAAVLYETESEYSYVSVRKLPSSRDMRSFSLNNGMASNRIVMDDITDMPDPYMRIYAAVTAAQSLDRNALSVLVIGGGGYVFPRYVEHVWPGSRIDVVEIDSAITTAAMHSLGLSKDTPINIITMDARNYVDQLTRRKSDSGETPLYDFVYGDAFNDFCVPYQMVTKEFNDSIARLLTDDGVYMLNVIDMYDSGKFLGALINTIRMTFEDLHIVCQRSRRDRYNSFVIIAGKKKLNLEKLAQDRRLKNIRLEIFDDTQLSQLVDKSNHIVLTDDFAPVENLLIPAVISAYQN